MVQTQATGVVEVEVGTHFRSTLPGWSGSYQSTNGMSITLNNGHTWINDNPFVTVDGDRVEHLVESEEWSTDYERLTASFSAVNYLGADDKGTIAPLLFQFRAGLMSQNSDQGVIERYVTTDILEASVEYTVTYSPWAYTDEPSWRCSEHGPWLGVPESIGVRYDWAWVDNGAVVSATTDEFYAIHPESQTEWAFDFEDACPTEPAPPAAGVNLNLSVSHNEAVAAVDTVEVYVHALDEFGNPETDERDVHVQSTFGEVSPVELVEPGVFRATLTSAIEGEATVTFTHDDVPGEQTEQVLFTTPVAAPAGSGASQLATSGLDLPIVPLAAGAGILALGAALLFFRRKATN